MYLKIEKDTETYKKLIKEIKEYENKRSSLIRFIKRITNGEIGKNLIILYAEYLIDILGSIHIAIDEDEIKLDSELWRKTNNIKKLNQKKFTIYKINKRTKKGKELAKQLDEFIYISNIDKILNVGKNLIECIAWSDNYIIVEVLFNKIDDIDLPNDIKEITASEFNKYLKEL